ncbi:SDR family oxidoreductase [Virgibacillus oceani]|uniref:Oxidoreductase YjdA n=1 Tax=Virgibacillus oceani TaxID=1479511 RepID=A0A917HIY2_9BACI|nr:SDR family oxidoreductase [Virgibacillus oceani]GGG80143.1 putative oxidoreductase YjdA [Virgibacillus oceani]
MKKLANQVAVVTGVGHSNGIGAAVCRTLAAEGAAIFFTHWNAGSVWPKTFQKELTDLGARYEHLDIDLSQSDAPDLILDDVTEKLGEPTILINNAAHSLRDGYLQLDAKTLDDHYAVNMRATLLLSVEFARRLQKSGNISGRIVNMTSGQGKGPMIEELAYGATKGAISAFTLSLSAEVAPLGITVNAVNPGPTDTGWMSEKTKHMLKPKFLMGRIGLPNDAARLIAFLVSDEAEWITGQVIDSEGGFLRQ